jgi:transcriptional regulator with XRE-family HTH domain
VFLVNWCNVQEQRREDQPMPELELLMPIKDRLKAARTAAGMTQQQLAFDSGLSISVVAHIESGRIPDPRISTLKAMARALGVGVADLVEDDDGGAAEVAPEAPAPEPPPPPRKPRGRPKGGRK